MRVRCISTYHNHNHHQHICPVVMDSMSVYGYAAHTLASTDSPYSHQPQESTKAEQPRISRPKSCPFLNLPYELRSQIYSYVLLNTTEHPHQGIVWNRATAPIWATNQQIYRECINLMYGNPTFLIDVRYDRVEFLYQ